MLGLLIPLLLLGCGKKDEDPSCISDEDQFEADISPILQSRCITCHTPTGLAGNSRNLLLHESEAGHLDANFLTLRALAEELEGGQSLLLRKIQGELGHGGGRQVGADDADFALFVEFVARTSLPGGCEDPGAIGFCTPGEIAPGPTPLRRLTSTQYSNSVNDLLGVRPADGVFPPTERGEFFSTWSEGNLVSSAGIEGVMLAAEAVGRDATSDMDALTGCTPVADACVRSWADDFLYRAFRRPLYDDEIAVVDALWSAGADPADRAALVVEYALQSPQFLYLDGEGRPTPVAGVDQLSPYATAARLSYFLVDSTPPVELMNLAATGELDTRAHVLAAARELVEDPRATPVVARFHQDWLHTYQLDTIAKDAGAYPEFGPQLVADMKAEIDLFTTEVVWLGDGTFDALLYSPVTWTSPALDAIYGTSGQRTGNGWERRTLDGSRPGVLTRSAFLTAHAYSATSAPVRRGVFVLEQMLCEELSPPPGVSLELDEATASNTIRDRLAGHASDPVCASCHEKIDPIGFSFEHYGAVGEWRDDWSNGIPVDASGTLAEPPGDFVGVPEMLAVLDSTARVRDCYAEKWFQYGSGRPSDLADQCELDRIGERFEFTGGDLRDLLVQIAASEAMRFRETAVLEDP